MFILLTARVYVVVCENHVHQGLNARACRSLSSTTTMAAKHANNPRADSRRLWALAPLREHLKSLLAFGPGRASDRIQFTTPMLWIQQATVVQLLLLLLLLLVLMMHAWASLVWAVKVGPFALQGAQ